MRTATVALTTDSSGAGTAHTSIPVSGEIADIYPSGTALGTATVKITRSEDGSLVWNGKVSGTAFPLPQPVSDGYLRLVVKGGGNKKSTSVRIRYEDD